VRLHRGLFALAFALLLATGCSSTDDERSSRELPRRLPSDHTGAFTTWWSDEQVREEGHYRQGLRHGQVRGYHPDGSPAFEGDFDDGVPRGEFKQYHKGGELAVREYAEDGVLQGDRHEYYESGQLKVHSFWVDGLREGLETRWYENGTKAAEGHFERGVTQGRWQYWNETGALSLTVDHWAAEGEPVGRLETVYFPEGAVSSQTLVTLREGAWKGRLVMWHRNGRRAALTEYDGSLRDGLDVSWDGAGRKRSEGRYVRDKRDGLWSFWDETGRLVRTVLYREGEEVSG
jgi:antitoxin component YwqK of YwqJK toxin-antitoxin module